jgi:hypothetical protein
MNKKEQIGKNHISFINTSEGGQRVDRSLINYYLQRAESKIAARTGSLYNDNPNTVGFWRALESYWEDGLHDVRSDKDIDSYVTGREIFRLESNRHQSERD